MHATRDLKDGFEIVHRYDPNLYERMQRSNWRVGTRYEVLSESAYGSLFDRYFASQAYGTTETNLSWRSGIPGRPPETFINLAPIEYQAEQWGIPSEYFLAAVLAHEFRHTTQDFVGPSAEAPAFAAGADFAAKLPVAYGRPIIELSNETAQRFAS